MIPGNGSVMEDKEAVNLSETYASLVDEKYVKKYVSYCVIIVPLFLGNKCYVLKHRVFYARE